MYHQGVLIDRMMYDLELSITVYPVRFWYEWVGGGMQIIARFRAFAARGRLSICGGYFLSALPCALHYI